MVDRKARSQARGRTPLYQPNKIMNNEPLAISGMRKPLLNVLGKGRISVPMRVGVYGQNGISCGRCRVIDKRGVPNE